MAPYNGNVLIIYGLNAYLSEYVVIYYALLYTLELYYATTNSYPHNKICDATWGDVKGYSVELTNLILLFKVDIIMNST